MNKWITRDKKLEKKRKRGDIYTKEIPHKDKFTRRDIKQAQKIRSWIKITLTQKVTNENP